MKRKSLPWLLLAILALATAAFAQEPVYMNTEGNTFPQEEIPYQNSAAPQAENSSLPPLGDPSGLWWDSYFPGGSARWETKGPYQDQIVFRLYLVGQPDEPVFQWGDIYGSLSRNFNLEALMYYANVTNFEDIVEVEGHNTVFCQKQKQKLGSGDYYFSVQNIGDGITYRDSAEISSLDLPNGIYHYVEPAEKLETPVPGHWEWPLAIWDDRSASDEQIETYAIDYGFSSELGGEIKVIAMTLPFGESGEDIHISRAKKITNQYGPGSFHFRIRARSADIEQWQNSDWSDWSEGYRYDPQEEAQKIVEQLNAIDKSASPDEVRQQVQALDRTELKDALDSDMRGMETGAETAVKQLEETLGGPAKPQVTDANLAKIFNAEQVSIVGAALNNVSGPPALNIGAPKASHDTWELIYNRTLAVDFSMDLDHVENTRNLAVPVKVTLPIPRTIHPKCLVILHHRDNDSPEEVAHTIFQDGGQWYVSFLLTGFSDFTLTERGTQGDAPALVLGENGSYQAIRVPEGARLFLARYDGERMGSIEELKELSGSLTGSGKLFLVSADFKPLCACAAWNNGASAVE